jgi:hypothetical protein
MSNETQSKETVEQARKRTLEFEKTVGEAPVDDSATAGSKRYSTVDQKPLTGPGYKQNHGTK